MNINGLSPLQHWLERIHGYLTREEILKARFASLVLPIFEAYELLTITRKICFQSSRQPNETFSDLTIKAYVLTLNVLLAGYNGFIDPERNYESHKADGLVAQETTQDDDIEMIEDSVENQKIEIIPNDELLETSHLNETKEAPVEEKQSQSEEKIAPIQAKEKILDNEKTKTKAEPKKVSIKSPPVINLKISPRPSELIPSLSLSQEDGETISPSQLDKEIPSPRTLYDKPPVLKAAPHLAKNLERKASITKENIHKHQLVNKGKSISHPSRLSIDAYPELSSEVLHKHLDYSSLPSKITHPRVTQLKSDQHSPGYETEDEASQLDEMSQLTDEQVKSIQPLLTESMGKRGSWKVKRQHIKVNKSTNLNIDPAIIDVLAKAYLNGHLDNIQLEQTFILHHNLKTIESFLSTLKGSHFKQLSQLREGIQEKLVRQWIESDYKDGIFYPTCTNLISQITTLIKAGEGSADDNHNRLFEDEDDPSDEVAQIFEDWKLATISAKLTDAKLTIYDYYEILKAYFESLPEPMQKKWLPVKKAESQEEWEKAIQSLPRNDAKLILDVLTLLKEAYQQFWKSDLEKMIVYTEPLFTHFCPFTKDEDEESDYLEYDYIKNYLLSKK